jgi:hypothetical protein
MGCSSKNKAVLPEVTFLEMKSETTVFQMKVGAQTTFKRAPGTPLYRLNCKQVSNDRK